MKRILISLLVLLSLVSNIGSYTNTSIYKRIMPNRYSTTRMASNIKKYIDKQKLLPDDDHDDNKDKNIEEKDIKEELNTITSGDKKRIDKEIIEVLEKFIE